ncbi:undecaprenyl-phosphate glucose phosphotransferase [Candidatus Saganbacteria bacterium CG08_land_8_20_14_0_20_45_16]|uniref:Undecaprenyl-phosphate glucose phosphotransferase n=1 Tax=Candidatus Saganbacteria bacterium CG08_land_8_20_14_0_20_45_16 TaxID=2014293 RepID=A0A2H0XZA4_UNCSA|nr:MAG: undecaprenyl-phosphate glucose phosphotransferase [Candidatus Saganbacteria bacterium CG08_land_8_20_14_0_20_45_16]
MLKFLADALAIVISFVLAYYIRFKVFLFIAPAEIPGLSRYLDILIFITFVWLAIFKLMGFYEERKYVALIDELALVFAGVTLASFVLVGLLFFNRELWVSRLVVINAWWVCLCLLIALRVAIFLGRRWVKRQGWGIKNSLILGAGEMGVLLAKRILAEKSLGYRIVGFLDDDPAKKKADILGLSVIGTVSEISQIIKAQRIETIIIASTNFSAQKILEIITECERYGVEFKLLPGILELIATRIDADELGGVPLLTVSPIQLRGFNAFIKRSVDLLFSAVGIILLSPLLLLLALLVKISSRGPVFFRQARMGRDAKTFYIYKFRSMVNEAEGLLPQLEQYSEAEGHLFKMKQDPRTTPLGRLLRRWSLDELPQLFNVFLGDMSLVGPRPPLPREVDKYNSWHKKRLRVRPGITGPWQVSGRSLLPFEEMVRLDIYYIENWSLWLDLKILLRTIPVVLSAYGAY